MQLIIPKYVSEIANASAYSSTGSSSGHCLKKCVIVYAAALNFRRPVNMLSHLRSPLFRSITCFWFVCSDGQFACRVSLSLTGTCVCVCVSWLLIFPPNVENALCVVWQIRTVVFAICYLQFKLFIIVFFPC